MKLKINRVPELRFPSFSDDWEKKKLGGVATFLKGKGVSKDDVLANGLNKCVRYGELYTYYGEIISHVVSKTNVDKKNSLLSEENDVLIPSSGETALDIAKVSCLKESGVILGGDLNVIRLNNQSGEFFAYYLSNFQHKSIAKLAQGNSVVHLYASHLKTLKIQLPSFPEQQKIAEFFGLVDEWLDNLRAQKECLERYKKGVMRKIFAREIRFKDDQGEDFADWEEKRLGEVGEIVGGGTPDTGNQAYWNGDINWFTPTEIKQKYSYNSLRKISLEGLKKSSAKLLPVGTLLLTTRATIADISISRKESATNQGFQSIIVNNNNFNEFLYYWILKNKQEFIKRANGSTFPEVSNKEVKKMKGLFPSLPEQQKIAEFLLSIDQLIELSGKNIIQTIKWKKALMQKMFI